MAREELLKSRGQSSTVCCACWHLLPGNVGEERRRERRAKGGDVYVVVGLRQRASVFSKSWHLAVNPSPVLLSPAEQPTAVNNLGAVQRCPVQLCGPAQFSSRPWSFVSRQRRLTRVPPSFRSSTRPVLSQPPDDAGRRSPPPLDPWGNAPPWTGPAWRLDPLAGGGKGPKDEMADRS